jgi:hypothetical protein
VTEPLPLLTRARAIDAKQSHSSGILMGSSVEEEMRLRRSSISWALFLERFRISVISSSSKLVVAVSVLELRYAQVVKHRRKRRVVPITTNVIFGNDEEVKQCLEKSPVSKSINISFVERNNLTLRQQSKRLGRKTNGFSKDTGRLEAQLYLALGYYHFVKEHFALRRESTDKRKKWVQRIPAMAAAVTDHMWSTRELLIYRVP